jgi:hypothetical protein
MDRDTLEFLDKEVFSDVTAGDRHEVDLVVRTRFRGQLGFFLIHVENQATARPDFAKRMFRYFARLHEKHDVPVFPVAILSYDAPLRPEPDAYHVDFPDRRVLAFHFTAIQLNRLNWRDFVDRPNPVAGALMAKMKIAPEDRPKVKLECLRLLATLRLNPAKMQLIAGFVETYLRLNRAEERWLEGEVATLGKSEQETVMDLMTSWEKRGLHAGRQRGKHELVIRQLRHRFGLIGAELDAQVAALDADHLDALAEALLDFTSLADAQAWVDAHAPK